MKTWHFETAFVAIILMVTTLIAGAPAHEWIGMGAVLAGFGHASIANRLAEQQATKEVPDVHCYKKLKYYWIGKEILWFSYFLILGAWTALVGAAVFMAYPFWRKYWRRIHPIEGSRS